MYVKCVCGEERELYAHYRKDQLHVSAKVELWSTNWRVPVPLVLASKDDPRQLQLSHYHCEHCKRTMQPNELLMIDYD